ncbi:MAG: spermidine synthase [Gammaproteobacteria bacterium]|nr:spermidine synthase [Gammaproteobacteria bacterium]MCP5200900.1 spermidine synthase [Gammaproteobacteria bacterium]
MSAAFEELDYRHTPIGAISLRRRHEPRLGVEVYEIKLDDAFLMSSLFTASEIALAELALDYHGGTGLDVVVGGLGLGYTAVAALDHRALRELLVVEFLAPVIAWHRHGLLPLGARLAGDPRCRLVCGDFFALASAADGFDPATPGRRFDAILVDIDHAPGDLLDARSAAFYGPDGLARLARHLAPGGVFGLWSNEPPDAVFTARLGSVFADARAAPVTFDNPYQDRPVTQTVYLARHSAG